MQPVTRQPQQPRPCRRILVLVLPEFHLLDLAGPAQVFDEARSLGGHYEIMFVGVEPCSRSAQGLVISDLKPLPKVRVGDLILVPGIDSSSLDHLSHVPVAWLRTAHEAGAELCSICSGAFVLAHAGLLDGRRCTTHWKVAERLQREYPATQVVDDRLFVEDGNVVTSAGIVSGIDTALWLVERDHGPLVAARVAREMVVYIRRDGGKRPRSIYLDYRTHLHPGVHRVQDWLVAHPDARPSIDELARLAGMSPRNLTRMFRRATGISLKEFSSHLKLEFAGTLLHNPALTVESVAERCGFKDARQLRRLWNSNYNETPSSWKAREAGRH